ncbi:molybdopterin-dependent oxidoreductase [Streptomyces sp. H27-H1]|uniref:molybdopterin-dependent oxidoreductase n=1 Tax=Streptomyces sp. H27-H1 TaxID=2996461 RepID=UPI00226F48D5|nr:molybdopterin-dependent oxidoreductase [Streptomyces sp. H27-H1]MCY0925505.1 molybdopterin-dependent oxidoreductase [Streptomyces sp. H27-H1]
MRVVSINRRTVERGALAAASGLLAGFAALAAAELTASLVRPQAGPVTVIGGAAIDRTPAALKDFAIRTFGENDKLVLQLGILATVGLLAALLGMFALRHRRTGAAGVLVFGALGAAAALGRPDAAGPADVLPSLVGAAAGAMVLYLLVGKLGGPVARPSSGDDTAASTAEGSPIGIESRAGTGTGTGAGAPDHSPPAAWNRRGFLLAAGVTALVSTGAGALGRALTGRRAQGAAASRAAVRLPTPDSPAPPIPAGASLRIPGVSAFTTPNKEFYRVDTALVVPKVDADTWSLRIHGKGVSRPRSYSFAELLQRPLIERDITLTCVSNEVGGPYAGSARWLGVRLSDLLREAGVQPPSRGGRADQLIARSVDAMTLGTPVEEVMDGRDAMLAVAMNGEPLPFEHGFPVRMLVPGLYGYVSACKWIREIELTTFDAYDPYWVKRGWARRAPIKTQARIDTPKPFARTSAGTVMVAGVAWAQHRGIERVEIQVDDGPWQEASLAAQATTDTWRQWSFDWKATPGGHRLTVRATDGRGEVQTELRARTIPDGASGRHSVFVTAG